MTLMDKFFLPSPRSLVVQLQSTAQPKNLCLQIFLAIRKAQCGGAGAGGEARVDMLINNAGVSSRSLVCAPPHKAPVARRDDEETSRMPGRAWPGRGWPGRGSNPSLDEQQTGM